LQTVQALTLKTMRSNSTKLITDWVTISNNEESNPNSKTSQLDTYLLKQLVLNIQTYLLISLET
jgi:hypothetical protein